MLDTHRVSLALLDAMATGRSEAAVARQLKQADRSRRLALLRAVLDLVAELAPPMASLPPFDEAWALLVEAQQRDPAATDLVLAHPYLGLWAAKALKRLAGGDEDPGGPPLWTELGDFHRYAVAAAIRAGHEFHFRVPVWRGRVMLPTLGLAELGGGQEWDVAHVDAGRGRVVVRGQAGSVELPEDRAADGANWLAVRTLRTDEGEVWLDDLDPYREFDGPSPPRRLGIRELTSWSDGLQDTWRVLAKHHPETVAELAAGLTTLVPRATAVDRFTPYSASHNDVFGSVLLSLPPDPAAFAAILVHEFHHNKLGALLSLVDLLEPGADNDTPRLYAPWRDDPRPPGGLLHGAYSFLGVTAFYRAHHAVETGPAAKAAQFEFAYRREQTAHAVDTLLSDAGPTELGRRFLSAARDQLRAWSSEPLPDDVAHAAGRANLDHRLCWRLRHLRVPDAVASELAVAWLENRPRPTFPDEPPILEPVPEAAGNARLELTRTWLTNPDLHDLYRVQPELAKAEIAGVSDGDLALADSDEPAAAALYRQQIADVPDSLSAWAGLALATRLPTLLNRPELVQAVHRAIRDRGGDSAEPVRLAVWLD